MNIENPTVTLDLVQTVKNVIFFGENYENLREVTKNDLLIQIVYQNFKVVVVKELFVDKVTHLIDEPVNNYVHHNLGIYVNVQDNNINI